MANFTIDGPVHEPDNVTPWIGVYSVGIYTDTGITVDMDGSWRAGATRRKTDLAGAASVSLPETTGDDLYVAHFEPDDGPIRGPWVFELTEDLKWADIIATPMPLILDPDWLTRAEAARDEAEAAAASVGGEASSAAASAAAALEAAEAAEDAATDVISGLAAKANVTDPRFPNAVSPNTEFFEVTVDQVGKVAYGIKPDGTVVISRLVADSLNGTAPETLIETVAPYTKVTMDSTGLLGEDALDSSGMSPNWVIQNQQRRARAALGGVACYGDSMTQGVGSSGATYPGTLGGLLPSTITVTNYGVSAQTSTEVAMRQGGIDLFLTVTGNQIPTSGAVSVTAVLPSGTWRTGTAFTYEGSLGGVPGVLAKSTSDVWTFTRSASGSVVNISPETKFISAQQTGVMVGQVYWAGRNNVVAATVARDVRAVAARARRYGQPVLFLSVFNSSTEASGSGGYTSVIAVNTAIEAEVGSDYFDLRGWLIRQGLGEMGLTATGPDTTAISEDRIPPSLMNVDGLHLNSDGYTAVGRCLSRLLINKGWFS